VPIEFGPDGFEGNIAEISFGVVAEEDDAIGLQRVQRIVGFAERSLHVGKRQCRKVADPI
jgi:hypothetical protein